MDCWQAAQHGLIVDWASIPLGSLGQTKCTRSRDALRIALSVDKHVQAACTSSCVQEFHPARNDYGR